MGTILSLWTTLQFSKWEPKAKYLFLIDIYTEMPHNFPGN